jgi:hypothetical protein
VGDRFWLSVDGEVAVNVDHVIHVEVVRMATDDWAVVAVTRMAAAMTRAKRWACNWRSAPRQQARE